MGDEGARRHLQVFHRQMAGAAVAGRAVVEPAGVLLRVRDELAHVAHRQVRVHQVEAGHLGQQRDRAEVARQVVGQLVEDEGVDRHRADVAEDDRVLVVGAGDLAHCHIAGAAGPVVDEDRLAEDLLHLRGGGAGDDLRAAARREGHDEADRLVRPGGLRAQRGGQGQRAGGGGAQAQQRAAVDPVGRGGCHRESPVRCSDGWRHAAAADLSATFQPRGADPDRRGTRPRR